LQAYTSNDQRIRALVAEARQAAARGQQHQADRHFRQAELEGPEHPLVLNQTALGMLNAGNAAGAVTLLEKISKSDPANAEVWFNLATALRKLDRIDEAMAALDRLLLVDPRNISGFLEKASLEELQDQPRAAAMSYRMALQMIPAGFVAPAWMEAKLRHARRAVDENNRALEDYIADGLAHVRDRYAGDPLNRFDQALDIILQKRAIYRQQPTFMYFPELPAIEFYPRHLFPWLDAVEAAADDIRAELIEALGQGNNVLDPYVNDPPETMDQWRELNNSKRWGVYALWREGKAYPEHMRRCPRTLAALKKCPQWDIAGNGPTALFSILDAKTHIPPHTGPVNTRLLVHLPLIVPPGCRFRVGGQHREWESGKPFVFDDSISHEAWNDSDVPRAIMIFDVWSPFLSEAERELARALTMRIAEWYGSHSNSRGADRARQTSAQASAPSA
jgi:aspartyl/asparaginyl beta-hydroxylase (cupin superfamily)